MIVGMPTTSFPRDARDPGGSFVLGLARALAARGHRVEVVAPEPDAGAIESEPAPGVRVEWVPYLRPRAMQRTFHRAGAPENLARDPLAWVGLPAATGALARAIAIRVRRWDAVVSHWGVPCGVLAACLASTKPHLAILHGSDVHALLKLGPLGRVLARRIGRGATTIGLASSELRARFLTLAPELAPRAEVIPMGVEPPPPIDRAAARRALGLSRPTLLALGRLVPIKGFDRAIDAVAGRTDVELVIAGEGPERSRLEQRARMRRAPTRFLGVITGEEKALWLAAADALIVPSRILSSGRSDTAPVVAREALAAGLPVIGSELPGLREIVGEAGILCENDAALAVAIDRLATLRGLLEPRARARGARWTWAAVTPTIEARLLSSPPSSALASSPAGPIEGAPAKGVSNGLRSVHWDGERAGPRWFTGGPIASTPKTDDAFQRMRDQGSTRSAEAGSTKEKTDPGSATSSS